MRKVIATGLLALGCFAIEPKEQLAIDERAYQAKDLRAYIVQYAYNTKMPVDRSGEVFIAKVTIMQIKRDHLVVVKKMKNVEHHRMGGIEPQVRKELEGE